MRADFIMLGGFLGAGKTLAMLRLAELLVARGRRVGLITNDQSQGLVDTTLAAAAGQPVREITGGCFCCRGDDLASIHLVRTEGRAEPARRLERDVRRGELVVNLRAEGDPVELRRCF